MNKNHHTNISRVTCAFAHSDETGLSVLTFKKSNSSLRKLLRIDSVISVNLYEISFLSLGLNIYKKHFIYL